MDRSLLTASVTMGQLQKSIDLISNNMSNVNTTGYKSRHASFSSLLTQQLDNMPDKNVQIGRKTPSGIRLGTGAALGDTKLNMAQGTIMNTGRPLDLALTKDQLYFTIQAQSANGKQETEYTRDGTFYLSPEAGNPGQLALVNKDGQFIKGKNGHIHVPSHFQKIHFDSAGNVQVTLNNGSKVNVGQLDIVQVKRPQLLKAIGGNNFSLPNLNQLGIQATDVLGTPTDSSYVKQGALEKSNVDLTDEMVSLMDDQRAYQLNARAITMSDQMMGLVNTIR